MLDVRQSGSGPLTSQQACMAIVQLPQQISAFGQRHLSEPNA
jgi:hypothetical protein